MVVGAAMVVDVVDVVDVPGPVAVVAVPFADVEVGAGSLAAVVPESAEDDPACRRAELLHPVSIATAASQARSAVALGINRSTTGGNGVVPRLSPKAPRNRRRPEFLRDVRALPEPPSPVLRDADWAAQAPAFSHVR